MCKIRDAGKVKARDRIAVLAALNLAFDLSDRAAAAAVPQAAGPAPVAAAAGAFDGAGHESQLATLIQRLDAVLGEDGRLI